jgi:hypothetical protein
MYRCGRYTDTDLFCNTDSDTYTDLKCRLIIGIGIVELQPAHHLRIITRALLQYATHSHVERCLFAWLKQTKNTKNSAVSSNDAQVKVYQY